METLNGRHCLYGKEVTRNRIERVEVLTRIREEEVGTELYLEGGGPSEDTGDYYLNPRGEDNEVPSDVYI